MCWSDQLGYQYTMGNLAASLALAQVEQIGELVAIKRRIFDWYYDRLKDVEGLKLIKEKPGCKSKYCYPGMLADESGAVPCNEIIAPLKLLNINLPSAADLTEADADFVCRSIRPIIGR